MKHMILSFLLAALHGPLTQSPSHFPVLTKLTPRPNSLLTLSGVAEKIATGVPDSQIIGLSNRKAGDAYHHDFQKS